MGSPAVTFGSSTHPEAVLYSSQTYKDDLAQEKKKLRMELLQCVNTSGQTYKRAYHSEDRDVAVTDNSISSSRTHRSTDVKSATLSGGERRVSLPAGQHYTSATMGRTPTEPSPTTLRKSSTSLPPSAAMNKTE